MLSKVGQRPVRLVCTDCGTPVMPAESGDCPHPALSTITMLGMLSMVMLIFFVTNPHQFQPEARKDRVMIKKVTTGQFLVSGDLLEASGHGEESGTEATD